ncbi:DUF6384 family protein [Pseudomonas sp. NCHU5208]|uniref:DUF6384 family protein n=1 Tax=unclassified Pseudomonas TaxID=196821 RepID=UPI003F9D9089
MKDITLHEQMGAMAIVDDLRHRQLLVNEQLDLPRRREEVARKIRDYYEKTGITASDEIIERGVRQFFATRLIYEQPAPLGFGARLALRFLVNRKAYFKRCAVGVLCIGLGWAATAATSGLYTRYEVSTVKSTVRKAAEGVQDLHNEASRQRELLSSTQPSSAAAQYASVARLSASITANLESAGRLLDQLNDMAIPDKINTGNYEEVERTLEASNGTFYDAKSALQRNRESIKTLSAIIQIASNLQQTTSAPSYITGAARYPDLQPLAKAASMALETADQDGGRAAQAAVDRLEYSIGQLLPRDVLTEKVASLRATYASIGLPASDASLINARLDLAEQSIGRQDLASAEADLEALSASVAFAQQALSIDVVSRSSERSGVERTYRERGVSGRAWFAIVEATDASGNVIKVPILDVETDKKAVVQTFGVRISEAEYQRLKEDKQQDGHIDNRHMGTKPAKSLTIDWTPRTLSARPDTLMSW